VTGSLRENGANSLSRPADAASGALPPGSPGFKIIQISDCHLLPPGETVFGSDPVERLRECIADINRHHGDARLCVVTGDLVHRPDPQAYAALRDCLGRLKLPFRLLIGNHDERSCLLDAFPETPLDADGFIQSVLDTEAGRLLFLDTAEAGVHTGAYCGRRQAWLRARIAERDEPLYVFAHHPPFAIELPHIDQYRMVDSDAAALGDILVDARRVRHLFCGHVHRPVSGSWRGIPFNALRGTNHQSWLDFAARCKNVCSLEPPAYAVIFLETDRTIVHFHDFLDQSPKYLFDPEAGSVTELLGEEPDTADQDAALTDAPDHDLIGRRPAGAGHRLRSSIAEPAHE
jgi:3',5'-cyclic AMP phosphodiesterase CpdA